MREALRRLTADGLIEHWPHRGAVVRRLTEREIRELFLIRIEMEALAARLAAAADAPERRARFVASIRPIYADAPRNPCEYLKENAAFHDAVMALADNLELRDLAARLQLPLIMAQVGDVLTPAVLEDSVQEHRAIAEAILKRDGAAASARMRAHLERAAALLSCSVRQARHAAKSWACDAHHILIATTVLTSQAGIASSRLLVFRGRLEAMADFHVSALTGEIEDVTFYFIESMAPDNVDPPFENGFTNPPGLSTMPVDVAVNSIAKTLVAPEDPGGEASLVIMVHGFNSPPDRVLNFYEGALGALKADRSAIFGEPPRRIICVAYRWPSESIGEVLWSSLPALPILPLWLLGFACIVLLLRIVDEVARWLRWDEGPLVPLFNLAGWFALTALAIAAFVVIALLLRGIVYFRDVYRATNYGVPDLVEVIRQIDLEAGEACGGLSKVGQPTAKAHLSFVYRPQHGRPRRNQRDSSPFRRVRPGLHSQ